MIKRDGGNWRIPVYTAAITAVVMLLSVVYGSDPVLLYLFFILPTACIVFLALFVIVIFKKRSSIILLLLTVLVFLVTSGAMLKTQAVVRPTLRWLFWSRSIKAQVLAQPTSANEELRHIEWDGWGGAPVGDWTVYVVYDPSDSLLLAAEARRWGSHNRYRGIPCEVDSVRRLERPGIPWLWE